MRISSYTTTQVIQLWQPGNNADPRPALAKILEAFHHPFNSSTDSVVQSLMFTEVSDYVNNQFMTNTAEFEKSLQSLNATAIAKRVNEHASLPYGHSHVDALTAAHAPDSIAPQTAHDLVTSQRKEVQRGLLERMSENIEKQINGGSVKGVSMKDLPGIKQLLFAPPSGDSPSPIDSGLAKLPGMSMIGAFEGIGISEIAAADGMGNTLRDAVVSLILLDEARGEKEVEIASSRFGWGRTEAEKAERKRLKELRGLLKIEKMKTEQEEGQFEEKRSAGDKLKDGFAKLKIKASRGS